MSKDRSYRQPYEFSKNTKEEARRRAQNQCEMCGNNDGKLEVHHILGVWYAINHHPEVSAVVIKSLENAICLCPKCHTQEHLKDEIDELMDLQADYLITLQTQAMFCDGDFDEV